MIKECAKDRPIFLTNEPGTNANKIILDLCGGTGSWSMPYKRAGYDVRVITLPDYDVLTYEPPKNVYGILAAPPCTEFSIAKGGLKRDLTGALEIVRACLRIIEKCLLNGGLKFWALENPVGLLRKFLGVPFFTFEQWQFGDNGHKPTDIWGYYIMPRIKFIDPPLLLARMDTWNKNHIPPEFKHLKLTGKDIRSITPPNFAKAFFEANQ